VRASSLVSCWDFTRAWQVFDEHAVLSYTAQVPASLMREITLNGTPAEAGDPVQLSPIRTTNLGQGFQGFYRPTA
jgi:hypothetical protein